MGFDVGHWLGISQVTKNWRRKTNRMLGLQYIPRKRKGFRVLFIFCRFPLPGFFSGPVHCRMLFTSSLTFIRECGILSQGAHSLISGDELTPIRSLLSIIGYSKIIFFKVLAAVIILELGQWLARRRDTRIRCPIYRCGSAGGIYGPAGDDCVLGKV